MKIFEKRPLSLILCIMLGGFSLFSASNVYSCLVALAISISVFIISFIFKDLFGGRNSIVRVICLALALTFSLCAIWISSFFPTKYYDTRVDVKASVESVVLTESGYTAHLKVSEINGSEKSISIISYGDSSDYSSIKENDIITASIYLRALSGDSKQYLVSRGYSAIGYYPDNVTVLSRAPADRASIPELLRSIIHQRIEKATNESTAGLISALLTGMRDSLDTETALNFKRIGITHILALSGMHLAILSAALFTLLRFLKVNKKMITASVIIFVLMYMTLTGFSASVTRAGVMLIISSLLFLLSRRGDGITTLTVAVFLIVLFSPTSAFDVSLWLSAFSTLGIIALTEFDLSKEEQNGQVKITVRLLKWLLNALLSSVFAVGASFFIILSTFDSFSALSVVTTLIFSPLIELLIYGGILAIAFASNLPFGSALIFLSDLIKELAVFFSSFKFALIPLDYIPVKLSIVAFVVLFFISIIFIAKKSKIRAIISVCISFLLIIAVSLTCCAVNINNDSIIYYSDKYSDYIFMKSDGEVAVIVAGSSDITAMSIYDLIVEERVNYLDRLVFTYFSYDNYTTVSEITSICKVESICLPYPENSSELDLSERLANKLSLMGTDLEFYSDSTPLNIGDYRLVSHTRSLMNMSDGNYSAFSLVSDSSTMLYLSDKANQQLSVSDNTVKNSCDILLAGGYADSDGVFKAYSDSASRIVVGANLKLDPKILGIYKEKGVTVNYTATPIEISD